MENSEDSAANVPTAEQLRDAAAAALTSAWGDEVRLSVDGDGLDGRHHVLRCLVGTTRADRPTSVIVKGAGRPGWPAFDPAQLDDGQPARPFFRDWLGVAFLDSLPDARGCAPRFFGGDRDFGVFIQEDLGAGDSLANVLRGDNPARATDSLMAFSRTLGRMHAASAGKSAHFDTMCTALGVDPEKISTRPNPDPAPHIDRLRNWCETLNASLADGAGDEIEMALHRVANPGAFLAYTHGDPCPDNDRVAADGQLIFFDFEHGGFRHALMDGVYGRLPFPTCWCVNRLPPEISDQMERVYRSELATKIPEAADDAVFARELLAAWSVWMLTNLQWHLESALEKDDTWGISSIRQRFLMRLALYADTTEARGSYPALGATLRSMLARLSERWSAETEPMPLYAAFRDRE